MSIAIKDEISEEQLKSIYDNFMKKYGVYLTDQEKWYLNGNYNLGLYSNDLPDIIREIYDMIDIMKDDKNIFKGFIEIIKNKFGLDRNILEIGGGIFPTLSKRIALLQNKGTITVYDPRLYDTKECIDNLKLIDSKFDRHTYIENIDLFIGLQPYGATEEIIKLACLNNIDFIIALGKAEESFGGGWYVDDEFQCIWERRIIKLAEQQIKDNNMGSLEITNLEKYGSNYPVIYNKRK